MVSICTFFCVVGFLAFCFWARFRFQLVVFGAVPWLAFGPCHFCWYVYVHFSVCVLHICLCMFLSVYCIYTGIFLFFCLVPYSCVPWNFGFWVCFTPVESGVWLVPIVLFLLPGSPLLVRVVSRVGVWVGLVSVVVPVMGGEHFISRLCCGCFTFLPFLSSILACLALHIKFHFHWGRFVPCWFG